MTVLATMWVIYRRPLDYPNHYVVRRMFIKRNGNDRIGADVAPHGTIVDSSDPTIEWDREVAIAHTLENVRMALPGGLIMQPRDPKDEAHIVETWSNLRPDKIWN